MKQAAVGGGFPTMRLVLVPALISLVVTLWRLTGELLSWSTVFFNPEAGGVGAVIGITWLAPIFGIYFALHLAKNGDAPSGWGKAIGFAVLGCLLLVAGGPVQAFLVQKNFFGGLLFHLVAGRDDLGPPIFRLATALQNPPSLRIGCTTSGGPHHGAGHARNVGYSLRSYPPRISGARRVGELLVVGSSSSTPVLGGIYDRVWGFLRNSGS